MRKSFKFNKKTKNKNFGVLIYLKNARNFFFFDEFGKHFFFEI